jgi:hypothetical protein
MVLKSSQYLLPEKIKLTKPTLPESKLKTINKNRDGKKLNKAIKNHFCKNTVSIVDPHYLNPDPDPAFQVNTGPDTEPVLDPVF